MQKLLVRGSQTVKGKVKVSGAKNAAVAILPAAILAREKVKISNLPYIADTRQLLQILTALGAKVTATSDDEIEIDATGINSSCPPFEMVKKLRASSYFMGSLVASLGRAEVYLPGGCDLGPRPIDQHLKGFSALGAKIEQDHGRVIIEGRNLRGNHIYLDVVSVGATINIMLAAVTATGRTIIENAAKEPEIVDTANFLNALGAKIRGAGTDLIKIDGVQELGGVCHSVIPDRIEAGTFMIAGAATGGDITVCDVIPKHLEPVIAKLIEMGVDVDVGEDSIRIRRGEELQSVDIKTFPYPGFPTDMQPMAMALLSTIPGTSLVNENVFDARFKHVDELKRMGAMIKVEGRTAVVEGVPQLSGAHVNVSDLRAGAALLIAGLMAEGDTVVSGLEHLLRGYEKIEEKFKTVGVYLKHED